MLFPLHITLLSIGILFLLTQTMVWNTSMLVVGVIAFIAAFFSVFFDPMMFLMM